MTTNRRPQRTLVLRFRTAARLETAPVAHAMKAAAVVRAALPFALSTLRAEVNGTLCGVVHAALDPRVNSRQTLEIWLRMLTTATSRGP